MPMIYEYTPELSKKMLLEVLAIENPVEQNTLCCFFRSPLGQLKQFIHALDDKPISNKSLEKLRLIITKGLKEKIHHVFISLSILIDKHYDKESYLAILSTFKTLKKHDLLHKIKLKDKERLGWTDDFYIAIEELNKKGYLNQRSLELYLKPGQSLEKLRRITQLTSSDEERSSEFTTISFE